MCRVESSRVEHMNDEEREREIWGGKKCTSMCTYQIERKSERKFTRLFMADKSLKLSFELETFGRIYFQYAFFSLLFLLLLLFIRDYTMRNEILYDMNEMKRWIKKALTQAHPEIRASVCGSEWERSRDVKLKVFWLMQTENVAHFRTTTHTQTYARANI